MFSGPWQLTVTRILILVTALIWIGWDFYVHHVTGNPSTESAVLFKWGYYSSAVPFLIGLLCGHIFFSLREPIDFPKDLNK